MRGVSGCVFLTVIFKISQGLPGNYGSYYPKRSMTFESYYSNPMDGYEFVPQGQMTAMVSGDTVATNSFSGPRWMTPPVIPGPSFATEEVAEPQPAAEPEFEKQLPNLNENEADAEFELEAGQPEEAEVVSSSEVIPTTEVQPVSTTKAPKVVPSKKFGLKRRAKKPVKQEEKPVEDIDDDDDEDMAPVWPFGSSNSRRGSSGIPNYNSFFPIFIGGGGSRSRTRSGSLEDSEAAMPSGSATAIANAFSTGKGGVATSHATSFGDPMAAAFLRNAGYFGDYEGFARRNKKPAAGMD